VTPRDVQFEAERNELYDNVNTGDFE